MAKIGYALTRKEVIALVQRIVDSKNTCTIVSNGWWERFVKRHPRVTLRAAVPFSVARAMASDRDVMDRYFDMLEDCLTSNGLLNKPSCIFNCDESGVPLNPKSLKVVAEVGSKHPSYISGGCKTQITVMACTCAAGYAIPPLVIFDRLLLNEAMTKGEVPGTVYGLSSNGWITREIFNGWFKHFLNSIPSTRPVILILDGHSSHYCPESIRMAAENQIIMCALPPHTTHNSALRCWLFGDRYVINFVLRIQDELYQDMIFVSYFPKHGISHSLCRILLIALQPLGYVHLTDAPFKCQKMTRNLMSLSHVVLQRKPTLHTYHYTALLVFIPLNHLK